MKQYKAVIVQNDLPTREMLVETLRFLDFEVTGYEDAEKLLFDLFQYGLFPDTCPDLVIVDLELEPNKMQGLNLIAELAERNVPSEVMAMSASHRPADFEIAMRMGAAAIVSKPLPDLTQLFMQIQHRAEIGMKRRMRLCNSNGIQRKPDPDRNQRPVFLSYSHKDNLFATGLRRTIEGRNVGVWYDIAALRAGDHYRDEITHGIDDSIIFVPLITDHYLESPFCNGELARFVMREKASKDGELVLLALIDGVSVEKRLSHPLLRPVMDRYQCLDLTPERFVDRMTVLLGRIDLIVGKAKKKKQRVRVATGVGSRT